MENRVKRYSGYWYDIILGGILTFIILFISGSLIFMKLGFASFNIYYFLFCVLIVIFFQWKDDNLETFETQFSKSKNFEIVEKTLEKLAWKYETNSTEIKLTYNKFLLNFLDITIIPKSEKINFNFKYHSTTQTGRFPFYFGISTFLKWKFTQSLKNELNNKTNF